MVCARRAHHRRLLPHDTRTYSRTRAVIPPRPHSTHPVTGQPILVSENSTPPKLSVIMIFPDGYDSRRRAITHLTRQTVRDELELLLVKPRDVALYVDEQQLECFHSW